MHTCTQSCAHICVTCVTHQRNPRLLTVHFSESYSYKCGRTPCMADRSVAKPMSTQKSTNAEEMPFYIHASNACLHSCSECLLTFMPRMPAYIHASNAAQNVRFYYPSFRQQHTPRVHWFWLLLVRNWHIYLTTIPVSSCHVIRI